MRVLLLIAVLLLALSVHGQEDPANKQVPELNYRDAEIRTVLNDLFHKVGTKVVIPARVTGSVSLRLPPQRFDSDLQDILGCATLTYRVEDWVYEIIPVPNAHAPEPGVAAADQSLTQDRFPKTPVPAIDILHCRAIDILERIQGAYYVIGPEVGGLATFDVPAMSADKLAAFIRIGFDTEVGYLRGVWLLSGPFRKYDPVAEMPPLVFVHQ